ncbi:MAG TPA: ion channel [Pseudonocardiaceae bacterium]|jgi:voltage-gated potassium channel
MAQRTLVKPADSEPLVTEWERRADWPLTGLAVSFLVGYAWSVLDTSLTAVQHRWLDLLLWTTWAVFTVDYLARLLLARRRWRFVRRHVLDLVLIALPMIRPLRALRLVTVLMSLNRQMRDDVRGRIGIYVVGATALVSFAGALAVYDVERRRPDASITTFGDALWWTITTISTVGYGDRYPVTWEGRLVAGLLMLGGIALLGTVTGTIASWFVEKLGAVEAAVETAVGTAVETAVGQVERTEQETKVELAEVMAELRRLHHRLDEVQLPTKAGS